MMKPVRNRVFYWFLRILYANWTKDEVRSELILIQKPSNRVEVLLSLHGISSSSEVSEHADFRCAILECPIKKRLSVRFPSFILASLPAPFDNEKLLIGEWSIETRGKFHCCFCCIQRRDFLTVWSQEVYTEVYTDSLSSRLIWHCNWIVVIE